MILPRRSERSKRKSLEFLFPLSRGGRKKPIFLVAAAASTPVSLLQLARAMGEERSVYSFEFAGASGGDTPHTTIDTMAAQYAGEVRKVQGSGPYLLGGHCFGGLVAFDMAAKLEAMGETVALLALLESIPPVFDAEDGGPAGSGKSSVSPAYDATIQTERALDLISRQTSKQLAQLPPKLAERFENLNRIHLEAAFRYRASPIDAPIALFLTYSHSDAIFQAWWKLSRGRVSRITVPGHTFSMLTRPHVSVLADQMAGLLKGRVA